MKHSISFYLSKIKDTEYAHLRCHINYNNTTLVMLVGYRVVIAKWSLEAQRCKNNTQHDKYNAQHINSAIERMIRDVDVCFEYYSKKNHIPTKDELKAYYNSIASPSITDVKPSVTLLNVIDKFIKEYGDEHVWSDDSYEKFYALRSHVEGYRDVNVSELDITYLNGWMLWLISGLNLRNTSILKQIDYMRMVLKWSTNKGLTTTEWIDWKPRLKTAKKKVIFLAWEELMTLYNFELPHAYMRHVRDVFCFCCFTGLRYSDVSKLKHTDIVDDKVTIVTQKDTDLIEVKLNKYSRNILNRYNSYHDTYALPVVSNQKYNDYIKEVCEVCGINSSVTITYYKGSKRYEETHPKYKLVSTHCARRTFVCNALMLGIPADIVMKWTGHSDYKAMKPYIDIADKAKEDAMSKFDEL